MDVFKLMGRIVIDGSGAGSEIDKITNKAGNASRKIATSFNRIGRTFSGTVKGVYTVGRALDQVGETVERAGRTIARGIAIGATAVSAAAVTIGKNALDIRSSIEQGMGGADAVFKQYSQHIKSSAQDAWQTAGLSVEEYLATANKMGSLFKGAGFTEMQAMEYTANAMQRAADVASIMGIDVSVAMESIAGAAKGNFTMMDNLGVAMNDTTLEAYRLEKGFDKAVSKMTTAEKVELAMQMFFERTADYAGNYAKENETAAGSLQTLKAAWSNFLGNVGTFEDLEKSAFGYLQIAAKTMGLEGLEPMINGAQETVEKIAEILAMEGLDGRQKFAEIRRYLLDKSVALANALGEKIPQGIDKASTLISDTLSDINVRLPDYIAVGWDIFLSVRDGIINAAENFKETAAIISPSIISGWFTLKTDFISIGLDILGAISDAITQDLALGEDSKVGASMKNGLHTVLDGLVDNMPKLTNLATALIDGIADAITSTDEDGTGVSEKIGNVVKGIVNSIDTWIDEGGVGNFTSAATTFLLGLGAALVEVAPTVLVGFVKGIWDGLTGILAGVTEFFSDEDAKELQNLKESLNGIEESFNATKTAIDLATQAYNMSMDDIEARLTLAEGYLDTIAELEEKAKLTPQEQSEWQNAVAALVALYPKLGEYVDDETGKFTINSEAIRENISALQDLARQKALTNIQGVYIEQATEITETMVKAQAALGKAEQLYSEKGFVKAVLGDRIDRGDYFSGFDTITTNYLKKHVSGFEDVFDIKLDGSSTVKKDFTGSRLQKLYAQMYGEISRETEAANADREKAREEIANGEQQLANINAEMQKMTEAYNTLFPSINMLGTNSDAASDSVSNFGTAVNGAAAELGKLSVPSVSGVTLNAKGAVFSAPTIFDTRLGRQMVGEAGPEAVAPIAVLQNYVSAAVQSANVGRDKAIAELANAISDLQAGFNANMNLYINKKHVASAMSRDMGRSIGNREYALLRGMGG